MTRILITAAVGCALSGLLGYLLLPVLRALKAGQSVREIGPTWHNNKAGTPLMGGLMFIFAVILCLVGNLGSMKDYTVFYVLALSLCFGLVGFLDDFCKVKYKRDLGLTALQKAMLQMAVSALFGAFNDIIKTLFAESLGNASGFLVGGLNGCGWGSFRMILPYALAGMVVCLFLPSKMNILMLGDETANSLGLRTELFRFILIAVSSLLSGAAIAAVGMLSFVGLIVPHIARILVGSDYRYLFPASTLLGFSLIVICDTIGRVIMPPGEVPVSIIISFIGAPFFLFLLRSRGKEGN